MRYVTSILVGLVTGFGVAITWAIARLLVILLELTRLQDAGGGGIGAVSIAIPLNLIVPSIAGFVIGFALMQRRRTAWRGAPDKRGARCRYKGAHGFPYTASQHHSNVPMINVSTQMEQIDKRLLQERVFAQAYTLFGVLALVLASVGLFGLLSYNVSRRTAEIGIRLALGAQHGDVLSSNMAAG